LDGQLIVFHDHDLRRLCASALAVEATTADVLVGQRLFDSGEHIPRLGDLLALLDGRVPLLVEVKCRGGNARQIARAVADELARYSGPVGVMSFEPAVGKWLANHAPAMPRGLVISERASAFDRWRGIKSAAPQFLAIDCGAIARTWVSRQRQKRRIYSWTIRTADMRETASVHADGLIWEGDGRPGI